MQFKEALTSSWKVYKLHARTIVTIIFLCTLVPLVALMLLSSGIASLMGVSGTLAHYEAAQEEYNALVKAGFLQGMTETLASSLEVQRLVVEGLQRELLPFFGVQGIFGVLVALIGLLGIFALLIGFFGKFGTASTLLREARIKYFGLLGTILAGGLVGVLGFVALFIGLVLVSLVAKGVGIASEGTGVVIGILGFLGFLGAGIYVGLGIYFTLYEAIARKTRGFQAVRGVWARMKGKRWLVLGYSLLLGLVFLVCFLPLVLLQLLFEFGTYELLSDFFELVIMLGYMLVAVPVLYFFYGFLYRRL